MWIRFYLMSGNVSGLCRIYLVLCLKMPFEYAEQVLSYVGKCHRSAQEIFYLVLENAV